MASTQGPGPGSGSTAGGRIPAWPLGSPWTIGEQTAHWRTESFPDDPPARLLRPQTTGSSRGSLHPADHSILPRSPPGGGQKVAEVGVGGVGVGGTCGIGGTQSPEPPTPSTDPPLPGGRG